MTHRFIVPPSALAADRVMLDGAQARQIASVLRLRPGDRIVLVSAGIEHDVELAAVSARRVEGAVRSRHPASAEPRLRLTLALPLLRGERSEEVVEAVAQLGVARIVPFVSARSVARELSASRRSRWERIAREAAETARRGSAPEIAPVATWDELFSLLAPLVVVAWEGAREPTLVQTAPASAAQMSLVIGPEGGLTEEEIEVARKAGARVVSLGRRNLRSETAAIAAVAVVMALTER